MSGGGIAGILMIFLLVIVLFIAASCVKIVPQASAYVVESLGKYKGTWATGLHFKVPFIERVAIRVNLKEQVVDFPPQQVITKDNVTMQIDTVVFFQITDPKLFAYGVVNPLMAIENLTATTLRNIIGDLELDETLTSREIINTKMQAALDIATDPWGIKVNRVELKNIMPPAAIQEAMEKQMKAERERREAILIAEGEKKSTILVAEGKKQSAILDAEAEKQAAILRAEAEKEKRIREAEGQAEAILKVQQANADGIRAIKEAGADVFWRMEKQRRLLFRPICRDWQVWLPHSRESWKSRKARQGKKDRNKKAGFSRETHHAGHGRIFYCSASGGSCHWQIL